MPHPISAAVIQLCSQQDVQANLATCQHLIEQAVQRGAELLVLPENFAYIGSLKEKVRLAEPLCAEEPGPIVKQMMELARRLKVHLLLGGTPIISSDPHHFYNTSILLGPTGAILASYRKIHLFDIQIPQGPVFTESEYVLPGEHTVTTSVCNSILGFSICYDLRFPELYRQLSQAGAQVFSVPAAFTLHTGKDHWHSLLRARAIENQCYVLAAAQHGAHTPHRTSYGKSCIIDPWGSVMAQVPDRDGFALAELDMEYLQEVRQSLPCLNHRRLP